MKNPEIKSRPSIVLTDEMIRTAFEKYDKQLREEKKEPDGAQDIEGPESGNYRFSEQFEKRMRKLIRISRRPRILRKRKTKVIALIAAILALFFLFTFSVSGIRERLYGLFFRDHQQYSLLEYFGDDLKDHIEEYYIPTYIPKGFELISSETSVDPYQAHYTYRNITDLKEQFIIINQYPGNGKNHHHEITVTTEDSDVREIYFHGKTALFVHQTSTGYLEDEKEITSYWYFLAWAEDGYIFTLGISGYGDYNNLLRIADSVVPEKAAQK